MFSDLADTERRQIEEMLLERPSTKGTASTPPADSSDSGVSEPEVGGWIDTYINYYYVIALFDLILHL